MRTTLFSNQCVYPILRKHLYFRKRASLHDQKGTSRSTDISARTLPVRVSFRVLIAAIGGIQKKFLLSFFCQAKNRFRQEFQAKLKIRDKDKFCRDVDFLGTED